MIPSNLPRIIGLCGPKGSGKTTLAQLLVQHHGYERVAFADGIKAMLLALFEYQGLRNGRARRLVYGDLRETPTILLNGKTSRHALQTLGTEWGRALIDPDLWINVWARKVRDRPLVVADDVRFLNEVSLICDLGGQVLRVERLGHNFTREHSSEEGIGEQTLDKVIVNDGMPEEMLKKVEAGLDFYPQEKCR